MELLIKFPTKSRPEIFLETYQEYINNIANKNQTRFIVNIDIDDHSMNNQEMIRKIKKLYTKTKLKIKKNYSKIEAINSHMENEKFNILLLASDDMIPQINGFDDIIRNDMNNNYTDLDGVLWYNDGYLKNQLNTLMCCGYNYYKRFNYIYAPQYKSYYCDLEFQNVANYLKKQTYFDKTIIKHQHPCWTKKPQDQLYNHNDKYYRIDQITYIKRQIVGWQAFSDPLLSQMLI